MDSALAARSRKKSLARSVALALCLFGNFALADGAVMPAAPTALFLDSYQVSSAVVMTNSHTPRPFSWIDSTLSPSCDSAACAGEGSQQRPANAAAFGISAGPSVGEGISLVDAALMLFFGSGLLVYQLERKQRVLRKHTLRPVTSS